MTPSDVPASRLGLTDSVPCRNIASVWVAHRPVGQKDYTEVARRILGPVPMAEAERAIESLRSVLEEAGFGVTFQAVADD
jgi:hypothetical protein